MKPGRVASSKLLERRWRDQEQQIHKERLRTVQSAVRQNYAKPPYQHNLQARNAKREAVQESKNRMERTYLGKYTEIERENRILLEKMSNIMQDNRPKLYNPSKAPIAKSE